MKLKANLSGNEHEISLSLAEGAVDVAVDDRHYDLQVRELASGEYLLIDGSTVYKCRVSGQWFRRFRSVVRGGAARKELRGRGG